MLLVHPGASCIALLICAVLCCGVTVLCGGFAGHNGVSEKLASAFPGWPLWLGSADRQRRRWTVVGRPADGRRRRQYRQRRRKKSI